MSGLRSVTFKMNREMYDQIQLVADKKGETLSAVIRSLIIRGLTERVCEENADLIAQVVRSEIEDIVKIYGITEVKTNNIVPELYANIENERLVISRTDKARPLSDNSNRLSNYLLMQSLRTGCPAN